MLFTFPSLYWFTIGHRGVFSLGEWSPQLPARFLGSRSTQDTSYKYLHFVYRTITFYGQTFQTVLLWKYLRYRGPTTPRCIASRFGLFPFRSPLLRESRLISFPPGTEMFQFSGLASFDDLAWPRSGFPIRKSMDQSLFPAPHGVSPVIASFIASLCQGIRHLPLLSY